MAASLRSILLIIVLLAGLSASAAVLAQGFSFNGVSNRIITPNGDGKNDNVAFTFSNPFDSAGSVKIFDMRGHLLTTIPINSGTGNAFAVWDARVNGSVVASGVYIYVLSVEGVVASGALVVIR